MNSKRIKNLSNLIILVVILGIFAVGFLGERSITISSLNSYNPIFNGSRENNNVSLVVSVYEDSETTYKMVEIFNKHQIKTTFFVGGSWADDNYETLKFVLESGHELGNNGYFNKEHKKLSERENLEEILNCDKIIYSQLGYKMNLFLPPKCLYNKSTLKASKSLDYKTIIPNKDTFLVKNESANSIVLNATKNLKNGDFILIYPTKNTLDALEKIIIEIQKKEYNLVTVSNCLYNNL